MAALIGRRESMARNTLRLWPLLYCLIALAAGCSRLEPPEESGELVVGILDDPVFYQPAPADGAASGFEVDLVTAFAEELKLKLRLVPAANPAQLRQLLSTGTVHFTAAVAVQPGTELRYTAPLREARLLLVEHADAVPLDEADELSGHTIEVLAGSPAGPALDTLQLPTPPSVTQVHTGNDLDLLARVADRRSELAATDSAHFDVAVNYYPDLVVAQDLAGTVSYAWAFPAGDATLHAKAELFIARFKEEGRLARLYDQYFGHIKRINAINAAQLLEDIRTLLPHYREDFQRAQALTGIDWRLIAALAYQESRWNPLATSPTGVRGMMMLTEDTADRLGVSNRLDVRESIRAGARYLADLMDQLPRDVRGRDRQWLALAAYNLGMGHLNGARHFAVGLKRDPTSWYEMKTVLPLLARPEYYSRLKAGRARGGEAVILVENIRTYFDILARFEPANSAPLQTGLAMQ
jgi:membrane-bound lytic murein transglycosylase F